MAATQGHHVVAQGPQHRENQLSQVQRYLDGEKKSGESSPKSARKKPAKHGQVDSPKHGSACGEKWQIAGKRLWRHVQQTSISNKLCAHNGQTIVILCFGEAEHGYLVQYHPRKGDITQVSQVLALPCQPQSLCWWALKSFANTNFLSEVSILKQSIPPIGDKQKISWSR
jgi:hypothetical protein